jgi:hypothetical protein
MKRSAKQKLIDNVVLVGYFAATPACFYFISDLGTAFLASLPIFGIFCFWLAYRAPSGANEQNGSSIHLSRQGDLSGAFVLPSLLFG